MGRLYRIAVFTNLLTLLGLPSIRAASAWNGIEEHAQSIFERINPFVVGVTVKPQPKESLAIDLSTVGSGRTIQSVVTSPEGGWKEYLKTLRQRERIATGLIVHPEGYILTTASVIRSLTSESALITLADGTVAPATPVAQDPFTNLAMLKVDREFDKALNFGDSDRLKIGSVVLGVARPYGRANSLFMGIVSNVRQELGQTRYEDLIQTSVPLHPGSIGGALVNQDGEVVGMLSTTQKQESWPELSFAIPSRMLQFVTEEMITHGSVTRGFLGVWVYPLTPELRQEKQLPPTLQGVMVTKLVPEGPAARGGLELGDVITHFNKKEIRSYQQLIYQTAVARPGEAIPVRAWRAGKIQDYAVTLAELSRGPQPPRTKSDSD